MYWVAIKEGQLHLLLLYVCISFLFVCIYVYCIEKVELKALGFEFVVAHFLCPRAINMKVDINLALFHVRYW